MRRTIVPRTVGNAPPGRLPGSVWPAHLWAGDPAARVRVGERHERRHGAGLRDRVRVDGENVVARSRGDAEVHVRREAQRLRILEHADAVRERLRHRARQIRDDDGLVDLRDEHREQPGELGRMSVRDDDRGDAHGSASDR